MLAGNSFAHRRMLGPDDAVHAAHPGGPAGGAVWRLSPVWETQAAVQALADERGRAYHQPWLRLVQARAARLDLTPLPAVLPRRGYVPDFLVPPPRTPGRGSAPSWRKSAPPARRRWRGSSRPAGTPCTTSGTAT
jgi:hypothetical protein